MTKKKKYSIKHSYTIEEFNTHLSDIIAEERIKTHLTYCLLMAYANECGYIDVPNIEFFEMGEMLGELVMQRF